MFYSINLHYYILSMHTVSEVNVGVEDELLITLNVQLTSRPCFKLYCPFTFLLMHSTGHPNTNAPVADVRGIARAFVVIAPVVTVDVPKSSPFSEYPMM